MTHFVKTPYNTTLTMPLTLAVGSHNTHYATYKATFPVHIKDLKEI